MLTMMRTNTAINCSEAFESAAALKSGTLSRTQVARGGNPSRGTRGDIKAPRETRVDGRVERGFEPDVTFRLVGRGVRPLSPPERVGELF